MPLYPRLAAHVLLFLAVPTTAEADAGAGCERARDQSLRELGPFLSDFQHIQGACRQNRSAPANQRIPGGVCERTYRFMNGFVTEARQKVSSACAQLGRASCGPGQNAGQRDCLLAAAASFRAAASELRSARELLSQAEKKMGEQKIQNAVVGRTYGENISRIQRTVELSRGQAGPRLSPLASARSDLTGADSLRTEGVASLREVLRSSHLPEEPRALQARVQAIDRAFLPGSSVAAEGLGPWASEQLLAYRKAADFAEAAARVGADLALVADGLDGNGETALAAAERLENQGEKKKVTLQLPNGAPPGKTAAGPRAAPRASRSDLQLRRLAQAAGLAGALAGEDEAKEKTDRSAASAEPAATAGEEARQGSPARPPEEQRDPVPKITLDEYAQPLPAAPARDTRASEAAEKNDAPASPARAVFLSAAALVPGSELNPRALSGSVRSPALSPLAKTDALIPTLAPDEPVSPELGAPAASFAREYSLRDRLRARLAADDAEERARSQATLASQRDPDAPFGEQDLRYDRRLSNLQPDQAAFSEQEKELAEALRNLTAAFPGDLFDEISGSESAPLFERVRQAHLRYQERTRARR